MRHIVLVRKCTHLFIYAIGGVTRRGACVAGTDAFQQCKKIVDTPFPYPYAQAVLFMLTLYTIFAPFLICEIVNDSARTTRY